MPLVGDVYGRLGLDSSGFTSGVAAAQQSAARVGQVMDKVAGHAGTTTDALDKAGKGFHLSGQSMDRFAAIGIEKVVPALEGSRTAVEGVLNVVYKLAGSYATLILAGIGVAGFLGSYLAPSFIGNSAAAKSASASIDKMREDLGKLEMKASSTTGFLRETAAAVERLDRAGQPKTPSGARVLGNLFNQGETGRTPLALEMMRRRAAIGDEFSEVGGLAAEVNKSGNDLSKIFTTLDKEIATFRAASNEVLVDDPLGKLLIADYAKTQRLIDKLIEARDQGALTQDEFDKRVGTLASEAGTRQIGLRGQATKIGEKDLSARLGLGSANLLTGGDTLRDLQRDIDQFTGSVERLAREGTPARDLFELIAQGQGSVSAKIAALKEQFADVPSIFNRLVDLEKQFGGVSLQKTLDEQVRSLADVKAGTVTVIDTAEGLETRYTPALSNAGTAGNYLAGVLYADVPAGASAAQASFVTLTQGADGLALALYRARVEAILLAGVVGRTGNVAVAAPGNF